MEPEREWRLELFVGLREELSEVRGSVGHLNSDVAELRATVNHLTSGVGELRSDVRRLDGRLFQLLLGQLATLGAALASLVAALAG